MNGNYHYYTFYQERKPMGTYPNRKDLPRYDPEKTPSNLIVQGLMQICKLGNINMLLLQSDGSELQRQW